MICPHCHKDSAVLTDKNKQVLNQLLNGLTNKEIGKIVGIKTRSVKAHIARSKCILQVKNRVGLAMKFKEMRDVKNITEPVNKDMSSMSVTRQ